MRKMISRWTIILVLQLGVVQAFDVKVLLQKLSYEECHKNPIELESKHGFILSKHDKVTVGYEYLGSSLKFDSKQGKFLINGKHLQEKILHVYPMLSTEHKHNIITKITSWLDKSKLDIVSRGMRYTPMFDRLIAADIAVTPQNVVEVGEFAKQIFLECLQALLMQQDQNQNISVASLSELVDTLFVTYNPEKLFIELLQQQHLDQKYRQELQHNQKKSQHFFATCMYEVVATVIQQATVFLPHTILRAIVQEPFNMIGYQDLKYQGSFILYQDKKHLYLINNVDIEDYLLSVVRHEGWSGWPHEMNKVLAVACRTYLIWQVLQAQKTDRPYHIHNSIKHQTYKGYHDCKKLKQAIDDTKNLLVSYHGKPALTMYDACCGGIVPGHIDDVEYKKIPYLARNYPCTFCESYKVFRWSKEFLVDEVLQRLKKDFSKLEKITDMYVLRKDKAGLVKKVAIISGSRKIVITEKKMKSLFSQIGSYCFDIQKAHRRFIIEGRGFGHHKGLCQWGACHLVKHEGWDFKEVLQFYYPGTDLMRLSCR